jgi:hypothetical protein
MTRMSFSFAMSLGVVPDAMSEWKPDTAAQAMVMKQKGNTAPANTGPVPSMNRVIAGIFSVGASTTIAMPSAATVPIFMKVLR